MLKSFPRYRLVVDRVVNSNCLFCSVDNFNVPCWETFQHLYLDCIETQKVIKKFNEKYYPEANTIALREMAFLGVNNGLLLEEVEGVVFLLLLYCIWKARWQKKISYATIEHNMEFIFCGILGSSKMLRTMANANSSLWCRHWGRSDGRWEPDGHGRG